MRFPSVFKQFQHFNPFPRGPKIRFDWVVKDWFFDRDRVKNMLDDETRFALQKFGQEVMYQAKRSMPWRQTASQAGHPPHAHKGKNGYLPPRGNLKRGPFSVHYSFDPINRGVIIGPEKFPDSKGEEMIPRKLEYGGGADRLIKNPRRRNRKVGDGGVIRIVDGLPHKPKKPRAPTPPKNGASEKRWRRYRARQAVYHRQLERYYQDVAEWREGCKRIKRIRGTDGKVYFVVFARLKTQKMVQRCRKLESKIYGPLVWKVGAIAPRPYMRPAFRYKLQFLPRYYQDARIRASRSKKYQ